MRKLLLATSSVVAVVMAAPAGAADLSVKAPIYRPVAPACAQFGGFFVGAFAGGAYYDHTWNDRDRWTVEADADLGTSNVRAQKSGFIGGVEGGYNWQWGCTVFGVIADYAWSSINAEAFETDGETGTALDTLRVSSKLQGIGTVRARTGIVVDSVLLYLTAGFAYGDFRRSASQTNFVVDAFVTETFESRKTKWGAVAGAGAEWAIWGNWSLQSEILYAWFEKDENSFICVSVATCSAIGGPPTPVTKRFEYHDSVLMTRIGLKYRFGGAPVLAKY